MLLSKNRPSAQLTNVPGSAVPLATHQQFYSPDTLGAAIVLADPGHNSVTIDIPFVSKSNAYRMPHYYKQCHSGEVFPSINGGSDLWASATTNGGHVPDNTLSTDNFSGVPYNSAGFYDSVDASYGPQMSPGTIFLFAMAGGNNNGPMTVGLPCVNVTAHAALGDDFRFGKLRGLPGNGVVAFNPRAIPPTLAQAYYRTTPRSFVPPLNAWAWPTNINPSRTGTVNGTPNGNTITTINKFGNAAKVTLPVNVTGDKFDTNASLKTAMMDKPTNTLGGIAIMPTLTSPFPNSTGIVNGVRMAIRGDETFEADPVDFATEQDEMDLKYLTSVLSICEYGTSELVADRWDITQPPGTLLFSMPMNPIFERPEDLGVQHHYPGVGVLSMQYLYWSGSLRYRFKVLASAFHTGRLFISFTYTNARDYAPTTDSLIIGNDMTAQFTDFLPASLESALTQSGVYIDLAEGIRDITIDLPFKAPTLMLDVPTKFQTHQKSCMGWIQAWIVNPLVAPDSVASAVDFISFAGGGPDYTLHTLSPFAAMNDYVRTSPAIIGNAVPASVQNS